MLTCPFHEGPITDACQLKKCDLWVKGHETHCALLAIQENEEGWRENPDAFIGDLLAISTDEIKELIQRGYDILRISLLKQQNFPEFSMVPNRKRCIVCRRKAQIVKEGWGWCSNDCYKWKPLQVVKLEQKWGESVRVLLYRWRKIKIRALVDITNMDYPTLKWLLWQHTGWSKHPTPTRWLKAKETPLVPSPTVPTKQRLLRRLTHAQQWSVVKHP